MWNIKKITILLCFLSLVAFISCSAEDKTGSPKPEGETEITGETGGGETGGSGSGGSGESGGSGSGSETGETKITIPAIYHGTYTFGWYDTSAKEMKYSEGDTVVISADKIVLARPEAEPSSWANGTYYVSDATIYTNNKTMDTSIAGNLTGYPKSTVYLYNTNSSGKNRTVDFRLHHDEAYMNKIGVDIDTSSRGGEYFKKTNL